MHRSVTLETTDGETTRVSLTHPGGWQAAKMIKDGPDKLYESEDFVIELIETCTDADANIRNELHVQDLTRLLNSIVRMLNGDEPERSLDGKVDLENWR